MDDAISHVALGLLVDRDPFFQDCSSRAWAGILLTVASMIRKLPSGEYRLYSRKVDPKTGRKRNLGTFRTREAAEKHERAVQFFKRRASVVRALLARGGS